MADYAKCATCGQVNLRVPMVEVPPGFVLECDKCRMGSPGKPQKTLRHCSLCREPIIVMGLSGGVRLTCRACANKDPELIEVEALVKERDKYRAKLNGIYADEHTASVELANLKIDFDRLVTERVQKVQNENLELKDKLSQQEDDTLTKRIQAKMRLQYGDSDSSKLYDFGAWLLEERGWKAGEEIRLDALVDYYLKQGGS